MALTLLAVALSGGCGEDEPPDGRRGGGEASTSAISGGEGVPAPTPARCPAGAVNCSSAGGRIIYVERVDPDGDGDAHFVLASPQSITAPGISVIDVRADLRPRPLPGPGDRISAAGPVYTGSYGQRQIQAEEVNVAR